MTSTTAPITEPMTPAGPLRAFWEFTRPHTIIGTSLAVFVFYALAYAEAGVHDLRTLLITYLASLGVNIYIVGLNQLTDVDIDRINKPYLPLASGAFTRTTATVIVAIAALIGLGAAALQGAYLLGTIGIVFLLGSLYSLPPTRFKTSPFLAATSITLARAVVGNIGVYLTYSAALTGKATLPPSVMLFVGFMFLFVVVIAVMKDVPDIEGDRRHQIATLVVRLGAAKTMLMCRAILTVAYLGMVVASFVGIPGVNGWVLAGSHALALAVVWGMSLRVDDEDPKAVYSYYMVIWKLFYFEFLAFPAACLIH